MAVKIYVNEIIFKSLEPFQSYQLTGLANSARVVSKPRNSSIALSNIDEKKSDNFFFCFKNIVLCSHSKRERSESAKRRGAERIIVELKKLHRALSLDSVKIKENGKNGLRIIYVTIGEARCF